MVSMNVKSECSFIKIIWCKCLVCYWCDKKIKFILSYLLGERGDQYTCLSDRTIFSLLFSLDRFCLQFLWHWSLFTDVYCYVYTLRASIFTAMGDSWYPCSTPSWQLTNHTSQQLPDLKIFLPFEHAIMCQKWASICPMLAASGRYGPTSGTLCYVYMVVVRPFITLSSWKICFQIVTSLQRITICLSEDIFISRGEMQNLGICF